MTGNGGSATKTRALSIGMKDSEIRMHVPKRFDKVAPINYTMYDTCLGLCIDSALKWAF